MGMQLNLLPAIQCARIKHIDLYTLKCVTSVSGAHDVSDRRTLTTEDLFKMELFKCTACVLLTLIMFTVGGALAGECCDAYTVLGTYNSAVWCNTYCCGNSYYRYCCSTSLLRVSSSYRSSTCSAYNAFSSTSTTISSWWVSNVWIYGVIGVVSLIIFVAVVVAVIKCVCVNNAVGGTVMTSNTSPVVHTVMATPNSQHVYPPAYQQPPQYGGTNPGYPPVANPVYPPVNPSGSYPSNPSVPHPYMPEIPAKTTTTTTTTNNNKNNKNNSSNSSNIGNNNNDN